PNITNWIGLKKETKGAGRRRQDSPPIPNDEHFAVAVQVGYLQSVQVPGLEFLFYSKGGQDRDSNLAHNGFLNRLVAAQFQVDLKVSHRFAKASQLLLKAVP